MKKIVLLLNLESPSAFLSSRAVNNIEDTHDYIPGTALRGAVASMWKDSIGVDSYFKELFTQENVFFCNLYITQESRISGTEVIPLTAYSCKYLQGFIGDSGEERFHGVKDILLSLMKNNNSIPIEFNTCGIDHCTAPLKRYKGYYYKENNILKSVRVIKRLIYHNVISPYTETSKIGGLYSTRVIEENQQFAGNILVFDDELANTLYKFIQDKNYLFLGSDKSRGLGKFRVFYTECSDVCDTSALDERIEGFNKKINSSNNSNIYFSLTLQSDTIVTDKYFRYKTFIAPEDLGFNDNSVEIVFGVNDINIISGWNSLTRLPKEDVLAIKKGSVFVYQTKSLSENIKNRLIEIEKYGIGKRKSEGYGRVKVCDPFHWQGGDVL